MRRLEGLITRECESTLLGLNSAGDSEDDIHEI